MALYGKREGMSKILTEEIARKHVGEYIDRYKRILGYYPKKIITMNDGTGRIGLVDSFGTCIPLDTSKQQPNINSEWYDYIFKKTEEE